MVMSGCELNRQELGAGYEFVNEIVGGVVPKEYIPAVDKGVQEQLKSGVLAGYPVLDVKVSLFDGSYHDVDSNEMAFKIAGSMWVQGRCKESKSGFTGANNESGSVDASRLYGRCCGGYQQAPRQ